MHRVVLLFILSTLLDTITTQVVLNPSSADAGKLPNGLLVFIPSDDKCQTGKLTDVIRLQSNTIVDLRERITNITEECPAVTKVTPLRPTLPPKPTGQCTGMANDLFKTSQQLQALKVAQTKADHEHTGLMAQYDKQKAVSTDACQRTFDAIGEAEVIYQDNKLGTNGVWMKDAASDSDKVWITQGYSSVSQVLEYVSEAHLKSGGTPIIYNLPFSCDGLGHVVHKGIFYCNKYNSNVMVRYELSTGKSYESTLSNAYTSRTSTGYYENGAYDSIDFEVDERGLWVIFAESSTGSGYLAFSKLDPDNLAPLQTWRTSFTKRSQGDAFMTCGVVYGLYSYNTASNYIQYSFDSVTYQQKSMSHVKFHTYAKDHRITSVTYHHKERTLLVWHYYSGLIKYRLLSDFQ